MVNIVLSEVDVITELDLCSDKMDKKDIEKLEVEFAKDIKIKKESTKLTVWNFVQNAAKVVVNENQEDNDEETKNEM